jgi:uncharacterized protein
LLFETDFNLSPMIIDLFQLSEPDFEFAFELPAADINLEEEAVQLEKPVKIAGNLRKGIAHVDINGTIAGEIEVECTRCLSPTKTPIDFPFKAVYVTEENYTTDPEAELRGEDLDVAIFDGEKIDLADLAREQILLNLPARFLCSPDCKGLCAKCGANKNTVNCICEENEIDPRWQALRDLKN